MRKILIFTNDSKASRTSFYRRYGSSYPSKDHPVSLFEYGNGSSSLRSVSECTRDGIYLVYDGEAGDGYDIFFDALLDQCQGDDLFVLVHSLPDRKNDFLNKGLCKPVEGMHEPGTEYYYFPIFDILCDESGNKEERIIRLLSPLESKEYLNIAIRFLNGCLRPGNDKADFIEAKDILSQDEEFGNDIRDFYENHYKKDNVFREYRDYFQRLKCVSRSVIDAISIRIHQEKLSKKII